MTSQGDVTLCCFPVATKAKRSKNILIGDTITVYVGPKRKHYGIHKALLTQYEWFHKKIFYSGTETSSRDSINLTAEDPKVFELLISWLYYKKFKAIFTTDEDVAGEEVRTCARLYLRACAWGIHELQNALMDRQRVRQTYEYGYFPRMLIKEIYKSTKPQSPLRSYLVDSFIFKGVKWDQHAGFLDLTDFRSTLTRKRAIHSQFDAGKSEIRARVLRSFVPALREVPRFAILIPGLGCVYHRYEGREKMREVSEEVGYLGRESTIDSKQCVGSRCKGRDSSALHAIEE